MAFFRVKEKRATFVTLSFFSGATRNRHNLEIYDDSFYEFNIADLF